MNSTTLIIGIVVLASIVGLLFSGFSSLWVLNKNIVDAKVRMLTQFIASGAVTFLKSEYKILAPLSIVFAGILYSLLGKPVAAAFMLGVITSALVGYLGLILATNTNGRAAESCQVSTQSALKIALLSGLSTSTALVSLGLLGISFLYIVFGTTTIIFGFALGASAVALFARVGGGIYTKAADIGADLVGKIEKGIPEDDARNPAVIADNVGDNVGDVAGMGADLYESYADSLIAAMILGASLGMLHEVLPLLIGVVGLIGSILGGLYVLISNSGSSLTKISRTFNTGALIAVIATFCIYAFVNYKLGLNPNYTFVIAIGLIAGIIIGLATEYFTSSNFKPTRSLANSAVTGASTNIIHGLSLGMLSTFIPVITIVVSIWGAYSLVGIYGIALSSVGMLSVLGFTLASDIFGPITDNASGILQMAKFSPETRKRAEALDAVGNTNAAITKGFDIGSSALASLALLTSYMHVTNLSGINISKPEVIAGLFLGAMLTFIFSALTMGAVGKAAEKMIAEVRRQFKTSINFDIFKPDYQQCIKIATNSALKQVVPLSLITFIAPIVVGLFLGVEALGALLAGTLVTSFLMGIFMANAGGAWDNAKKYIEEGHLGGKGSKVHKAAIVGDTVGDPLKDTSGPSLNILVKLISIMALVFVPLFI